MEKVNYPEIEEAYRSFKASIEILNAQGKNLKTLLFTSTVAGEGRSSVIAGVAKAMAGAGKKVLVMECDFRNPSQAKLLGVAEQGMYELLTGNGQAKDMVKANNDGVAVLPAGISVVDPVALLASARFDALLAEVKEQYDFVLLDAPAALNNMDACTIATKCDGTVMVCASGMPTPDEAKKVKAKLEQAGAKLIGVLLTKVDVM